MILTKLRLDSNHKTPQRGALWNTEPPMKCKLGHVTSQNLTIRSDSYHVFW